MKFLSLISDIDNAVCFLLIDTIAERSHIRGIIVESTVRFLDNQRHLLFWHENAHGSVILCGNATGNELINHRAQKWVVERLTNFLEVNVETVVDLLEFYARQFAEHLPALDAVLIS